MGKSEQELLQSVLDARSEVSGIEETLKSAKQVKAKAEEALIEHMDDTEKKSFKSTAFPCTVTRKETLYVSIRPEVKDEGIRFVEEDCGRPDVVKKSVHHKTLSKVIGDRLKDSQEVPQDVFEYFFKPELSIRMSG